MSALTILKLPRGEYGMCASRCMTSNGCKDATVSVWMIDRPYNGPAGHNRYCGDCAKQIQALWADVAGVEVPIHKTKHQRGRERAAAALARRTQERLAA